MHPVIDQTALMSIVQGQAIAGIRDRAVFLATTDAIR
jgi:hypothetical protein